MYMSSNSKLQRTALRSENQIERAPLRFQNTSQGWMNATLYYTLHGMHFDLNGVKQMPFDQFSVKYFSKAFTWLVYILQWLDDSAEDGGQVVYNGVACRKWTAKYCSTTFELLVTDDNTSTPVRFYMDRPTPGKCNTGDSSDSSSDDASDGNSSSVVIRHLCGKCNKGDSSDGNSSSVEHHVSVQKEVIFTDWAADERHMPHAWEGYDRDAFSRHPRCGVKGVLTTGALDNQDGRAEDLHKEGEKERKVFTPMYIFHPEKAYNLSSQNLGDAVGEVAFLCANVLQAQAAETSSDENAPGASCGGCHQPYSWITELLVQHNPKMGQYQNCNGYVTPKCLGKEGFLVGHEAAFYLGNSDPTTRQCHSNPLSGEWFSLPAGGRCDGNKTIEGGQCTWQAKIRNTIDSECLFDKHDFKAACVADGHAPFPSATRIFLRAFAENDVAKGGCPLPAALADWVHNHTTANDSSISAFMRR
jgi:hypothetical protein